MARPGRPERNRAARSFRQLRRFHHGINSDKVFGTHRNCPLLVVPWNTSYHVALVYMYNVDLILGSVILTILLVVIIDDLVWSIV